MAAESIIAPTSHTTQARSLAKTVSWRVLASIDTFLIGWLVTGNMMFAGSIASLEVLTKMLLYYGHERAWARVLWGVRHDAPAADQKARANDSA